MERRFYILFFLILMAITASSQLSRTEYIKRYQLLAIEEMNRSGIPASITMAQACLESADGNSELSKKSNNHFGIKCKSYWKGKKTYFDDDEKNECFRKYKSVRDSYIDHTNFLMENPRYYDLFQLSSDDYVGWAKGLKKAGYATARDYDKRLIKIVEDFQLYRLDYQRISIDELTTSNTTEISNRNLSERLTINPFHSHQITKFNNIKAVVAKNGDSYEIIAQEMGMEPWELYSFNDLYEGYRPQPNEIIYIQPKKRKASKNKTIHIVEANETMHYISQLYGVKLRLLYRRNNMKLGDQPVIGQEIHLRSRRK
ncbi:MAG: hypothetical protein CSA36_00270 [Draconibacterium sp.]|nr:MAG: hypothetical protein CSA36_00270 [Draconibacterium sp.]